MTRPAANGELLTLEQLAERLEWEGTGSDGKHSNPRGRRLRGYLKSRERQLGVTLMVARGTGRGTRYHVDGEHIRKHCPELFGHNIDDLHAQFRKHLSAIDRKIEARVAVEVSEQIDGRVLPALRELQTNDRKLAEQLVALSVRVATIAGT